VPLELAKQITSQLSIPTIGIGAGKHCDGQVLVCYDLLGMNPDFKPKFVKRYTDLHGGITAATHAFFAEVREGAFPDEEHSFKSKTIRLVTSNPEIPEVVTPPAAAAVDVPEGAELKIGPVYGVPV
jgi:3-methyl-2-oxobutanoate hydroxymethyltransferase